MFELLSVISLLFNFCLFDDTMTAVVFQNNLMRLQTVKQNFSPGCQDTRAELNLQTTERGARCIIGPTVQVLTGY